MMRHTLYVVIVGLSFSSRVRNLSISYADQSQIYLIWTAPRLTSDATKTGILRYSVTCEPCGGNVTFIPARSGLNSTR